MNPSLSIETLWRAANFTPNPEQEAAILHLDGPLYLPAGPGSGKTRVLLWRTLNLIVFHDVSPDEIFLSTFTEKAALLLQEGLRTLLGLASNHTGLPYDISKMYIGTVHSLCRRLVADRRLTRHRQRGRAPVLLDELSQYFYLTKKRTWRDLVSTSNLGAQNIQTIIRYFDARSSLSRHQAVQNCRSLFNRLSEECLRPEELLPRVDDPILADLLRMYGAYKTALASSRPAPLTDFSLLQQHALAALESSGLAGDVFKHVIVDEYQDTNTVQERLFFKLAGGRRNLCVVGDDDQALYRFRGATVENFVDFPDRCQANFGLPPRKIVLATNYRSRARIVRFYTDFMTRCDWRREEDWSRSYRVADKGIKAHRQDSGPAVVASTPGPPELVCAEIARLARRLLDTGKVRDPNQIAFLFPSLKSVQAGRMKAALEKEGLRVYAPRAGRFLEVDEAVALFGLLLHLFGRPERGNFPGRDYHGFHDWLDRAYDTGRRLLQADPQLRAYAADLRAELAGAVRDREALLQVVERRGWELNGPYDPERMRTPLQQAAGLSPRARKLVSNPMFDQIVARRRAEGKPFGLKYIINRATSVDWNLLDLFYRLCGFAPFKGMLDLAETGLDEGPACNLGLISQYLSRFMDEFAPIITAEFLAGDGFQRLFVSSYLYTLFRLEQPEPEDAEDPFPRGRIPFLTIHQAKGLEFPVVVLGNPRKDNRGPQRVEAIVHPFLERRGEPLSRSPIFDMMRMFYVALSRPKNLLVIAHFKSGISDPFKALLGADIPRIPQFDLNTVPEAELDQDELPRNYSYTGDFLLYRKCPRQYMVFRKFGFVPSRSQTMFFGRLVHRTLEDLHQFLIDRRQPQ